MAKVLTSENFQQEVLGADLPCLVDFFAEWCGPCKMMGPIIDELSAEYKGKFNIFKINVDDAGDIASEYDVMSIPTLIIFKGGEAVETITGAVPKNVLNEKIKAYL